MRFDAQDLICFTIRGKSSRGAAVVPGWRHGWSRDYRQFHRNLK